MALQLDDCTFFGPALPEPFVKLSLEAKLQKKGLLPKTTGADGNKLNLDWDTYRNRLRKLGGRGGPQRVFNQALEPLSTVLGYANVEQQGEVATREGMEDGGWLMTSGAGGKLRVFAVDMDTDLDAPSRRGHAYRFSPSRVAQRVLLASGERIGLLTDGEEVRILICDPARPDSHIAISLGLNGGWRGARRAPDSFRLLVALCCPPGVNTVPELTEEARLSQTKVTDELRVQAQRAIVWFIQGILDDPKNARLLAAHKDKQALARNLWREGLIMVYRLLFVFKLEASPDPARAFSFASTSLWRNTYSPNTALGKNVRRVLDDGAETGAFLESALRTLFRIFVDGLESAELRVSPLGGALFGAGSTALLDELHWGELAVAHLLDQLLWTSGGSKASDRNGRQRVHYGSLDVEDLGRVYEALLELEPGIATEDMCRLRRDKLEVVVSEKQGAPYKRAKNSKVEFADDIPAGSFYLRVGLGRKSTGSYYTPHAFVRFLIQETLGPQVSERSPTGDPQPAQILALNVLDPAMGSGHFLVEACRFLGEQFYEACRLCDELASKEDDRAKRSKEKDAKEKALARAIELRKRVEDLPDPNDELLAYLPSRVAESDSGLSHVKALALCRRLVAVHCLYGVDKNPLAVELAKLSLWLESYAEGLPLTFLDHRLICGDSLTGARLSEIATYPGSGQPLNDLLSDGLVAALRSRIEAVIRDTRALEASIGKDLSDIEAKRIARERREGVLSPFKLLAHAWSGGIMLGSLPSQPNAAGCDDGAYLRLFRAVTSGEDAAAVVNGSAALTKMVQAGANGVSFDLCFPEIFFGTPDAVGGFDALVGNPPWEAVRRNDDEFFAAYDLRILSENTKAEKRKLVDAIRADASIAQAYASYVDGFESLDRLFDRQFQVHKAEVNGSLAGRGTYDVYMLFGERGLALLSRDAGRIGLMLPSAFHGAEGATGLRRMFLRQAQLKCCYSFENRRKLFEIDSRYKFAAVVAASGNSTSEFDCSFYLHDVQWLFSDRSPLRYSLSFVEATGGEYLTFLELSSVDDERVAKSCFSTETRFGMYRRARNLSLSQEVNMTYDAERFVSATSITKEDPRDPEVAEALRAKGYLPLHEGKTFHQYNDSWDAPPRYLVRICDVADRSGWLVAAAHYRLAFRDISNATNERTAIFSLLPPGVLLGNTAPVEREPHKRSIASALEVLALANSYTFDWTLRKKGATHVNLFILDSCPVPEIDKVRRFLAHTALRLSCNHAGYSALWKFGLGGEWREATRARRWPVLKSAEERQQALAAIDAVVATCYGLTREAYGHVLGSFNHKSWLEAPTVCMAAFRDIEARGLAEYCTKHDPYADVPLDDALPSPVLEFEQLASLKAGGVSSSRKTRRRATEYVESE